MTPPRTEDWLRTFTGRKFYVLDPKADQVCIEDIAHGLAFTCRYGGHVSRFYSVAEHSLYVAGSVALRVVQDEARYRGQVQNLLKWAILHDASEAYLGDMIRPLKWQPEMALFREAEARVMAAIAEQFGLIGKEPELVRAVDKEIIGTEARKLKLGETLATMDPLLPAMTELRNVQFGIRPEEAEAKFLAMWEHLSGDWGTGYNLEGAMGMQAWGGRVTRTVLEDSYYYELEDQSYGTLWHLGLTPWAIDKVVETLSVFLGEVTPEVYHLAYGQVSYTRGTNQLVFKPDANALTVCHEYAHILENRNGHDAGPTGHDELTFLLTCLCTAVLEAEHE